MSETVEIGGRVFRAGLDAPVYRSAHSHDDRLRKLIRFWSPDQCSFTLNCAKGLVEYLSPLSSRTFVMPADDFVRWAGEELPAPVEGERL